MREAGFEPAHPEIRRLKRRDINRASRFALTLQSQTFLYFYNFGSFVFSFERFKKKWVPNNASKTAPSHGTPCLFSCRCPTIYTNLFFKLFLRTHADARTLTQHPAPLPESNTSCEYPRNERAIQPAQMCLRRRCTYHKVPTRMG